MRLLFILLLAVTFVSCTSHHMESAHEHSDHNGAEIHFEPHYSESLFKVSENQHFSVEILLKEGKFKVGGNSLDIIIHGKGNKDVEGAGIKITPWMPEHGHGVMEKAIITERGAGLYSVENVNADREGLWELRIDIRAKNVQDHAIFAFPEVRQEGPMHHEGKHGAHAHHADPDSAPKDMDFSTSKPSSRKMFQVSYKSNVEVVPLNSIHTWSITVNSPDGTPVNGAEVKIEGGMPEHGHGLPTRPLVTREVQPGIYLAEGMKFNMPGWWTVTFKLKKEDKTDSVTFNLDVQ